jgi:hypothetical protein
MRVPWLPVARWVGFLVAVTLAAQLALFGVSELTAGRPRGLAFLALAALLVAAERHVGVERFL